VTGVAFSPDGSRLASAGGGLNSWGQPLPGEVKVWDAAKGREILTLTGHTGRVTGVAFSPDGTRLAGASDDQTVRVWDAAKGREILTLTGHTGRVTSVAFSPDGSRLASAGHDGTVKVRDARTGHELLALQGHTNLTHPVSSVAFSPDGSRLAGACDDGTVRVWDAATGREVLTLTEHTAEVFSVAFSPDGSRLASAGHGGTVKVWDARSGQELLSLRSGQELRTIRGYAGLPQGQTDPVWSVAFSPDGGRLASPCDGGTVKVWDARSGQELLTLGKERTNFPHRVTSVAFSPDGSRLAGGSPFSAVRLWDARASPPCSPSKGTPAPPPALRSAPMASAWPVPREGGLNQQASGHCLGMWWCGTRPPARNSSPSRGTPAG
jgi:WD40 repeat protein